MSGRTNATATPTMTRMAIANGRLLLINCLVPRSLAYDVLVEPPITIRWLRTAPNNLDALKVDWSRPSSRFARIFRAVSNTLPLPHSIHRPDVTDYLALASRALPLDRYR